jgi:uncharacterized protein YggE
MIVLSLFGCNESDYKKPVLLNINASGEIEVVPDIAAITVNVSCTNKDLSKSNDCTKKSIDELFTLLDEHKILKEDYHSSRINLEKEYIWRKNSQVFNGFKSSSSINILFKNLEIMSSVLTKTMTMRNVEVFNLNYSHSNIDTLTNKAYLEALDNSNNLANEFKNKLNAKSVEILEINNTSDNFSSHESKGLAKGYNSRAQKDEALSTIQINPGSLKLIKNIYVLYSIKF